MLYVCVCGCSNNLLGNALKQFRLVFKPGNVAQLQLEVAVMAFLEAILPRAAGVAVAHSCVGHDGQAFGVGGSVLAASVNMQDTWWRMLGKSITIRQVDKMALLHLPNCQPTISLVNISSTVAR